jgi:signal transduction histidine kinase/ligand-binding sensor domain-containing protein
MHSQFDRRRSRFWAWCVLALGLCTCLAQAFPAGAQAPSKSHWIPRWWSTAEGLPQNSVNDIVILPSGEAWLATFGGLVRFDGATFHTLDTVTTPGLLSSRIVTITLDDADGLWAGSQFGDVVHIRDGRVVEVRQLSPRAPVRQLRSGGDGTLWACVDVGILWRFDTDWREITLATRPGRPALETCPSRHAFLPDTDSSLWVAEGSAIFRINDHGEEMNRFRLPSKVYAIRRAAANQLIVGTADALLTITGDTVTRVPLPPDLRGPFTEVIPNGTSYDIVANDGVFHVARTIRGWDVAELEAPSGRGLSRALIRDNAGNLWAGFERRGLGRFRPTHVVHVERDAEAVAVTPSRGAGVLAAIGCGEAIRIENSTVTPIVLPPGGCTNTMIEDRHGVVWIGTSAGLARVGAAAPLPVSLARTTPVTALVESRAGVVWIGYADGRVVGVANDRVVSEFAVDGSPQTMAKGIDETVWVGTHDSLLRIAAGKVDRWDRSSGLPVGAVRSVLPQTNGTVWVATYGGGLARLDNNRIRQVTGLPDNGLSGVIDDDQGRLWIMSNQGLLVVDTAHISDALERRFDTLDVVVLGPEAGVPEGNYGVPSTSRDHEGRLWFCTIEGVVQVNPVEFPFNHEVVPPRLDELRADGERVDLDSTIRVGPGTGRLSFGFSAPALTAADRVVFRWRLDGVDRQWSSPSRSRTVSYTRLAPGGYTFRIIARNEDGVWGTHETSLPFTVLSAWYQTWWARSGGALGLVALLATAHRVRMARVRARNRALAHEIAKRRRAQDQAAVLRDQLEHVSRVTTAGELATSLAHEVNQPLAAIATNAHAARRYLDQPEPPVALVRQILDDVARQAQRASDVIQSLRSFLRKTPARRSTISLNDVIDDVLPLIRVDLEAHHVILGLDLRRPLPPVAVDRVQLQQVIINLVSNAREATAGNTCPQHVWLRTWPADGTVRFECRDNGSGIAASALGRLFDPFVTTKPDGMGMGLAISRSIVESNGGRLWYEELEKGVAFVAEFPTPGASCT